MFLTTLSTLRAIGPALRPVLRARYISRMMAMAICLVLITGLFAYAQPASAGKNSVNEFFRGITGEWIGTCQQSTDGKQADDKYFHAVIRSSGPDTFTTQFEYYRLDDKTGGLQRAGSSTVTTTIASDGTAKNRIAGTGEVMVDKKPKPLKHDVTEVMSAAGAGSMQALGSGSVSVSGMPLGLGKNGKVRSDKSTWSMTNGVLNIRQNLDVAFKALFFTKSFSMVANYTARRGSNVAMLVPKGTSSGSGIGAGKRG